MTLVQAHCLGTARGWLRELTFDLASPNTHSLVDIHNLLELATWPHLAHEAMEFVRIHDHSIDLALRPESTLEQRKQARHAVKVYLMALRKKLSNQ